MAETNDRRAASYRLACDKTARLGSEGGNHQALRRGQEAALAGKADRGLRGDSSGHEGIITTRLYSSKITKGIGRELRGIQFM